MIINKTILGVLTIGLIFTSCKKDEAKESTTNTETGNSVTKTCDGLIFTWNDVTNPVTGKTWMDRNLGAIQVATSSIDSLAFGDLYQWGRESDGHQCRNSDTTHLISESDNPGHESFIVNNEPPYDWRSPQNDNLWQGTDGVNNPCPDGYRLPTELEWEEEVNSWSSKNADGAYGSVLKLTLAGDRDDSSSSLYGVGTRGVYWSSTVSGEIYWSSTINGKLAHSLFFESLGSSSAGVGTASRTYGRSIRCIKD